MSISVVGVDLGKTVCSVAGLDEAGCVVLRRRVKRLRLLTFLEELTPCVVAMEACCGAHHVARTCQEMGHEARLMPAHYVRPYVKVHKNDDRDAEAIAEAATRPTMSFVPVKSEAQLDLQAIHESGLPIAAPNICFGVSESALRPDGNPQSTQVGGKTL